MNHIEAKYLNTSAYSYICRYKKVRYMNLKVIISIPQELDEEIEKTTRGRYRSKQEFILECVREKLDRLERQQEAKA